MGLSPNDIRSYKFKTQMRGYSKDDVDALREQAAAAVEKLNEQVSTLTSEKNLLKSQLDGLKEREDVIKNAAIDARRGADQTLADARKEAESICAKAKQEAQSIISEAEAEVGHIRERASRIEQTRKAYLSKLRNLIAGHLDLVDDIVAKEVKMEIEPEFAAGESSETEKKVPEVPAPPPPHEPPTAIEETDAAKPEVEPAQAPDWSKEQVTDQPTEQPQEPHARAVDEPSEDQMTESLRKIVQDEQVEPATPQDTPTDTPSAPTSPQPDIPADQAAETDTTVVDAPPPSQAAAEQQPDVMDPELAEALNQYQRTKIHPQAAESTPEAPEAEPTPAETPEATDSPDGFITASEDFGNDTAEIPTMIDATEEEQPKPPPPSPDEKPSDTLDPDNLASALDSVVAKFEEEMDKAERS
jgi:DivIVA domain-containing protein